MNTKTTFKSENNNPYTEGFKLALITIGALVILSIYFLLKRF